MKMCLNLRYVEIPDDMKGESIIVFVILKDGVSMDEIILGKNLFNKIRIEIGPIATPKKKYTL